MLILILITIIRNRKVNNKLKLRYGCSFYIKICINCVSGSCSKRSISRTIR